MPYRLGDIVVRSAFNEVFTFLFMPLVLLGLLYLIEGNKKRFYLFFILGCSGLIYSQMVMADKKVIIPYIITVVNNVFKWNKLVHFAK